MPGALVVEKLSKIYSGTNGVTDISFTVPAGHIFGLLGPNGAGKTTTIRTISTILAPTSGTAQVNGFDIVAQSTQVRQHLGVLTTDIGAYDRFSGRENLTYFGKLYGLGGSQLANRITELSKMLDMEAFLDRKAGAYSTGMKQKLAVARTIVHDPAVMMLDEPTTGLDVLASQTVLDFIKACKHEGKAVVFSTHTMIDAERLCDSIAIMDHGKIKITGTPDEIKKQTNATTLTDAFLTIVNPADNQIEMHSKGEPNET